MLRISKPHGYFGIVQLEALASGVPIAAFPVTGRGTLLAIIRLAC